MISFHKCARMVERTFANLKTANKEINMNYYEEYIQEFSMSFNKSSFSRYFFNSTI